LERGAVHFNQEFSVRHALLGLAVSACLALPAPLLAQTTGAGTPIISIEDARRIATQNGVATIKEIELDDGKWEIEGTDSAGRERDIEIDARSGQVVKMDKD
jgi:uncharacterized membrane protein YkoI